jgi:spoIIIJ-associated protein
MAENSAIKKIISQVFELLEIEGTIDVTLEEDSINVNLSTEDAALVIGYHGDTLESLQVVLSLVISKKLGEFKRVSLEVADYKKNRSEWLTTLAYQTKERVLSDNKEIYLPDLKAWERRIVHVLLQDDKEVISESVGEGKERTLVIKPRN